MQNWKKFESNATAYLKSINNIENIKFENEGGSDSNTPDIKVFLEERNIFNIEAKLSPSQAGQFVVHKVENKFVYSTKNKKQNNVFSKQMISHMNEHFEKYADYGTNQLKVGCPKDLAFSWIKNHYQEMNNKFTIVSDKPQDFADNFIKIIPIDEIDKNFDVEIVYRIKRSGTGKVPKGDFDEVEELLKSKFQDNFRYLDRENCEVKFSENQTYESQSLSNKYHISKTLDKNTVRKRSQTFNANIIFTLTYSGNKITSGFEKLFAEVRKYIVKK